MFVQTLHLALVELLRVEIDGLAHAVALAEGVYTQFIAIHVLQHYNQSFVALHFHVREVNSTDDVVDQDEFTGLFLV